MQTRSFHAIGSALAAALIALPVAAQDFAAGKEPTGETPRSMSGPAEPTAGSQPVPGIEAERGTSRALALDPEAAREAFTIVGRSKAGDEVRMEPGEDVMRAIEGERPSDDDERGGLDAAEDPDHAEADRGVFGDDSRIQIANSTQYPYTTVGFIQFTDLQGEAWNCTGALIGPKVILTAAHCLYNHEQEGGWYDDFVFWPALNGETNAPYGGFEYDTVYVFSAYIERYDGTYDSIWPYDFGLIELAEPIGDSLGWLGYWNYEQLGDFEATLVSYHNDKTPFTMWRSSCAIAADVVSDVDFLHDCDSSAGASGAPIYVYDRAANGRYVVGVNVGSSDQVNWALRLYQPVVEWIQAINRQ